MFNLRRRGKPHEIDGIVPAGSPRAFIALRFDAGDSWSHVVVTAPGAAALPM
jgi:hypothetical protein